MDNAVYQTHLLEFIAWRSAAGNMDFDAWQTWFRAKCESSEVKDDAGNQQSAETIHGGMRAQPAAHEREVPRHDEKPDARLRLNLGERLAAAKERFSKK